MSFAVCCLLKIHFLRSNGHRQWYLDTPDTRFNQYNFHTIEFTQKSRTSLIIVRFAVYESNFRCYAKEMKKKEEWPERTSRKTKSIPHTILLKIPRIRSHKLHLCALWLDCIHGSLAACLLVATSKNTHTFRRHELFCGLPSQCSIYFKMTKRAVNENFKPFLCPIVRAPQ